VTPQAAGHIHEVRAGERIDNFKVGRLLHEGGMARLYRVTHARYRLPMVMKVPRLEPGAPLASLVAHENEWRILERLHGAHVPRLVAAGELTRAPYLVMEYIEGDRLARAAQQAPRPVAEIVALVGPLCRALHELHRQNVIHLDLNPHNVRQRANGEAVLVDFGIAHHAALPDLIDAAFGEEEGTTAYIAPEQVRHLRSESRSDIYALGAMLYLLATGSYPFGRPNLLSVHKRLFEPPRPPRHLVPDLPPWLQEVTLRCLEIRPEHRYATARQVAHALAHPESVHLTRRAHATRPAPWWTRTRLWWRSLYHVFDEGPALTPLERVSAAPHVLVALDPSAARGAQAQALRQIVRRLAAADPHSTFTCLAVLAPGRRAGHGRTAGAVDAQLGLRQWAAALRLPPARLHCLALPGQPARVIVGYARTHQVDHIVMGARAGSAVRRLLGSVSSRVAGEAPCTVTVVRARHDLPSRTRPRTSRRS
jgi:nucleotide-binding universal stress UspA family protein/predicted Ser/Thr protein kinase